MDAAAKVYAIIL